MTGRGGFWTSEEGQRYIDSRRQFSALNLAARYEPRSKSARRDPRLRQLLLTDMEEVRAGLERLGARWPRPRANVALDLWFSTRAKNPPRIDSACKRLLDELGASTGEPIVYRDDRQIKMLFARLDTAPTGSEPLISVHAQTVTQVLAGLRRANSIESAQERHRERIGLDELLRDREDEDWVASYQDDMSEFGREWFLRSRFRERRSYQDLQLAATDALASETFMTHALEQRYASYGSLDLGRLPTVSERLSRLLRLSMCAIDLGLRPTHGQTDHFRTRVSADLEAWVNSNALMFPLLSAVGLTLFYVEGRDGKDLDNLFRELLPIVFETISPPTASIEFFHPREQLEQWEPALSGRRPVTAPGICFIEGVALPPPEGNLYPPGTVIMALSPGHRWKSWWAQALSDVEEEREKDLFSDRWILDGRSKRPDLG